MNKPLPGTQGSALSDTVHRHVPETLQSNLLRQSRTISASVYTGFINWLEKYLLVLVIGGLLAGIGVASISQPVVDQVDYVINRFMDLYDFVDPIAIFLILTPSLARLFSTRTIGKFGLYVISWYAVRKVLACLWAIVFILGVFRIPILPQGSLSLADGIVQTMKSLGEMATTSTDFWAMYSAVGISLGSTRVLEKTMTRGRDGGKLSDACHAYLHVRYRSLYLRAARPRGSPGGPGGGGQVQPAAPGHLGLDNQPHTPAGMLTIYVIGAVLTAIACLIWQFAFLFIARSQEPRFSIIGHFRNYWVKVYPLAVGHEL